MVEIYNPADSDKPYVTTAPRYKTAAAAENDTIAILATGANNPRGGAAAGARPGS